MSGSTRGFGPAAAQPRIHAALEWQALSAMVACDGVRALALASIPIALAAGSVPFELIAVVALLDRAGFVVTYVTECGAMRQLVPPDLLGEAVARNESRTFGARVRLHS